jgi:hypothetical protein
VGDAARALASRGFAVALADCIDLQVVECSGIATLALTAFATVKVSMSADDVDRVYTAYPPHVGRAKALDAIRKAATHLGTGKDVPAMDYASALSFSVMQSCGRHGVRLAMRGITRHTQQRGSTKQGILTTKGSGNMEPIRDTRQEGRHS